MKRNGGKSFSFEVSSLGASGLTAEDAAPAAQRPPDAAARLEPHLGGADARGQQRQRADAQPGGEPLGRRGGGRGCWEPQGRAGGASCEACGARGRGGLFHRHAAGVCGPKALLAGRGERRDRRQ